MTTNGVVLRLVWLTLTTAGLCAACGSACPTGYVHNGDRCVRPTTTVDAGVDAGAPAQPNQVGGMDAGRAPDKDAGTHAPMDAGHTQPAADGGKGDDAGGGRRDAAAGGGGDAAVSSVRDAATSSGGGGGGGGNGGNGGSEGGSSGGGNSGGGNTGGSGTVPVCTPDCTGRVCGSDGCDGTCDPGCVATPAATRSATCFSGGCTLSNGTCATVKPVTCFRDADKDGHGDTNQRAQFCTRCGSGYVDSSDDCDDANADAYPGRTEQCDSVDNDCNGTIDNNAQGCARNQRCVEGICECVPIACGMRQCGADGCGGTCGPGCRPVGAGAEPPCITMDCNQSTGTCREARPVTCYFDKDRDGSGDDDNVKQFCTSCPSQWVTTGGDCDDDHPDVRPTQQGFFMLPRSNDTWDYNCDHVDTADTEPVESGCAGVLCTGPDDITTCTTIKAIPPCGTEWKKKTCSNSCEALLVCSVNTEGGGRIIRCH